jgi:hypothetical protein
MAIVALVRRNWRRGVVLNLDMKRSLLATAGAVALCGLFPAAADATITELGATTSPLVAPTCPKALPTSQCLIILNRVTALETIRDNIAYPSKIKQPGRIVAFTVGLSALSSDAATALSDTKFLDKTYGGDPQVAITVLKPVGKKTSWTWSVVAQSPLVDVQPYLGQVVQFPLTTTIPVVRGETIALTTPTWAPVLSIDLSTSHFAYRQSRGGSYPRASAAKLCGLPPSTSQAQVSVGQSTAYSCDYPGTRVEYSATEVTSPVAPTTTTTK